MPLSALPPELQDIENHFPDDATFGTTTFWGKLYYRYQKETKTWFAFSYRCTEWWAKWRITPKVLFRFGSNDEWRCEEAGLYYYLSRVQYYKRWHIAVQWPLMISAHFYWKAKDVPVSTQPLPDLNKKLWFFFWNHYDADNIYWMITSIFLGRCWK